jgi:hypothetical protein
LVRVDRQGREAHVTARYRDHEIVIQRRPASYPLPVRVDHGDAGRGVEEQPDQG